MQTRRNHSNESTPTSSAKKRFITEAINAGLHFGGTMVSETEYEKRLEVCRRCELAGQVEILMPGGSISLEGCTECGCPFATKPKWKKYFSFKELKIKEATCPHPQGNRWDFSTKNDSHV